LIKIETALAMMACSIKNLNMLLGFANASSENLQTLQDAYDSLMVEVMAGKGAQVISASSNGASFTFAQGSDSMSNLEWATCLFDVITKAEDGTNFSNFSIARVC